MDIVLAALNAKYIHTAFGLRYLRANLGDLRPRSALLEFDIAQRPLAIAERILALEPRILGLGVYVWNVTLATELVALLKRLRPDLIVVLGGPEVSFETDEQVIVRAADYTIAGEADLEFAQLCRQLLAGSRPDRRIVAAGPPDLTSLRLPYEEYTDEDLLQRIVYVEASRGCPFECEFCLSSLDETVRQFPLAPFLSAMQRLLDRGARQFKFVDRTFNLHLPTAQAILEFFLERAAPGLFLHFEMVPDRLPGPLREVLARFPPGSLQLEVGIQTFNPQVAERIRRRQHLDRTVENLRFLREQTHAHLHTDLIAGLPGEDLGSFAAGFDRLLALRPQEIQVGILKRLRGAPIRRHDAEWDMVYSPLPPWEILRNRLLDFATLQSVRRFARYWDLVVNSGSFVETAPSIWEGQGSAFAAFARFGGWLHARVGVQHGIALNRLAECLFAYLTTERGAPARGVAAALARDYARAGRPDPPAFLRNLAGGLPARSGASAGGVAAAKRQRRHRGGAPESAPP